MRKGDNKIANAKRDENREPTLLGVSSIDSLTPIAIEAEPTEKALHVFIKGTDVATGGTSAIDDADFSAGTTNGTPMMGAYQSTPTAVTDGDLGIAGITVNREVKTVDTNLITVIKAEDAGHSTGDKGIMALAVENEDQADLSTGDKDYTPIAVTKEGDIIIKQKEVIPTDALNINASITISNDDAVQDSTMVITKTIGGVAYEKTISLNAAEDVIAITVWSIS